MSIVKMNADIEAVFVESLLVIIVQGDQVEVLFVEPEVFFKGIPGKKDVIEPQGLTVTDTVVDDHPGASGGCE